MSFGDEWDRESANAIAAQKEIVKVVSIGLFSGTITSSPVGNPRLWKNPNSAPDGYTGGSFRANWYLTQTVGSVKYNESKKTSESEMISGITATIEKVDSSQWILTNNAPYGPRIEAGWSTQAPNGVIAPNVLRVESQIPKIAAITNKKYGVN
ncbi:neck protein [Vibrio phage LP.2]|nr:neck protein [Vibrio phage LP.2]